MTKGANPIDCQGASLFDPLSRTLDEKSGMNSALLVIDVQEDFCPPNGALAVNGGREVAPAVNRLLAMPFRLKIATRDWHPPDHVSFASSHHSTAIRPFDSKVQIVHQKEVREIPVWPVHCVKDTPGAQIISEIDVHWLDLIVDKGRDASMEMFSGFADIFGHTGTSAANHDLAKELRKHGIKRVFVTGLAGDYCVSCTAMDAKQSGFDVVVLEDAVRSVDSAGWIQAQQRLTASGVRIVSLDSPEMASVIPSRINIVQAAETNVV